MDTFVTGGSGFIGTHLLERLEERGDEVHALVRSEDSARLVESCGASPVRGDLGDVDAMMDGMAGCDVVFHLAAKADRWGPREAFVDANVRGTENVIAAARKAGVDRLVFTSTARVLTDGGPVRDVDETAPYPDDPVGIYPETKSAAERRVIAADDEALSTISLRPPTVWGPRNESLRAEYVDAIEAGRFVWFDGGTHLVSTTHVYNAVEAHLLAADHGRGGAVYFVTDGDPIEYREFVTSLVRTAGVEPPDRSVPTWLAEPVAGILEAVWRALGRSSPPPIDRGTLALIAYEMTVDDSKARAELGYEPVITREEGLAELRTRSPQEFSIPR